MHRCTQTCRLAASWTVNTQVPPRTAHIRRMNTTFEVAIARLYQDIVMLFFHLTARPPTYVLYTFYCIAASILGDITPSWWAWSHISWSHNWVPQPHNITPSLPHTCSYKSSVGSTLQDFAVPTGKLLYILKWPPWSHVFVLKWHSGIWYCAV